MKVPVVIVMMLLGSLVGCGEAKTGSRTEHSEATAAAQSTESERVVGSHLKLSPTQIRAAGIELASAGPVEIREGLSLYGVVAPNAEHVMEAAARFPGVLRTVNKRVGDAVQKGEVLATVESNESLQTYPVVAPLSGVVTARNANPGEQTGDKSLFTVADLSTVWVELSLFPRDLPRVHVGQSVRVTSKDAELSGEGKIVYVAPFGSSGNQTLTARVLLANPQRNWPPGLYVSAEVTLGVSAVPLAVSSQALQTIEGENVVFTESPQGFDPRPVKLGRSDGQSSEILGGLSAGDRYVMRNSFVLKAELGKSEAGHEE